MSLVERKRRKKEGTNETWNKRGNKENKLVKLKEK
jgi:hypothetical protein